jgi:hypothetical protein
MNIASYTINDPMKIFFFVAMLVITGIQANSQCDKKIKWSGAKGEMYNIDGTLLDTRTDSIFLEMTPGKITLMFQADNKALEGVVTEKVCDWKDPFKNGRSVYHATVEIDGQSSNATFTLEAKDQKILLTVEIDIRQGRKFVIYIDKYEELK